MHPLPNQPYGIEAGIRFDPVPHRYYAGDVELISVSRVIEEAGLKPGFFRSGPEYRQRGEAVHLAAEDVALKVYRQDNYGEIVWPYATAMRKFCDRYAYSPEFVEITVGSAVLGVAGRLDQIGTVKHRGKQQRWLLDVKSGTMPVPSVGIQIAGYDRLRKDYADVHGERVDLSQLRIDSRVCLLLKDNGDFDLSSFDEPVWDNRFLAAVTIHHTKQEYGLLGRKQ